MPRSGRGGQSRLSLLDDIQSLWVEFLPLARDTGEQDEVRAAIRQVAEKIGREATPRDGNRARMLREEQPRAPRRPQQRVPQAVRSAKADLAHRCLEQRLATSLHLHSRANAGRLKLVDSSGEHHVQIVVSKRYREKVRQDYWISYSPQDMDFLREAPGSFLVVGAEDGEFCFALPLDLLVRYEGQLSHSRGGERRSPHANVAIYQERGGYYLRLPQGDEDLDITEHKLSDG